MAYFSSRVQLLCLLAIFQFFSVCSTFFTEDPLEHNVDSATKKGSRNLQKALSVISIKTQEAGTECNCGPNAYDCSFEKGEKKCTCKRDFSQKEGTCQECDCGKNAKGCVFSPGKVCTCFLGDVDVKGTCIEISPCLSWPCQNGGTCRWRNRHNYTCTCPKTHVGINCEQECNCGPNAYDCSFEKGEKKCTCERDFSQKDGTCQECDCGRNALGCAFSPGKVCTCSSLGDVDVNGTCIEISPCLSWPCQNGGTCWWRNRLNYTCTCPETHIGINCEQEISPCMSWPCQNGGTCSWQNRLNYTCTCPETHNGTNCEQEINPCETSPCQNGGICVRTGGQNYTCTCPRTHNGTNCELVINSACNLNPCRNEGECKTITNDYICFCTKWFAGRNCTEDKWCVEGPGKVFCKSGYCSFDHKNEIGFCKCPKNREKVFNFEMMKLQEIS